MSIKETGWKGWRGRREGGRVMIKETGRGGWRGRREGKKGGGKDEN